MRIIISIFIFASFLFGCSTIDTTGTCTSSDCSSSVVSVPLSGASVITNGVIYSLPRQNVKLVLTNELTSKKKLQEKVAKEEKGLIVHNTALESLKKQKKTNEDFIAAIADQSDSLQRKYQDSLIEVNISIGRTNDTIATTKKKISALNIEIEALPFLGKGHYKLTATATALTPYPDSDASLSAVLKESLFSSETIEIKTTDSGLLSGGTGSSKGNIDEIFVALAGAVGAFRADTGLPHAKSSQMFNIMRFEDPAVGACKQAEFKNKTFIFDPSSDDAASEVNHFFKVNNYCYKIEFDNQERFKKAYQSVAIVGANSSATASEASDNEMNKVQYFDGLVYPRQSQLKMRICETKPIIKDAKLLTCKEPSLQKQTQRLSVNVINPGQLGVVKLKQGFFADNSFEFEFANGLLTRFKSDYQNELVSFFSMFPEAAKAIVSIPAEIIQLKFDLSDKEKAYYEAQVAIYQAQLKYDYYKKNPSVYTSSLASEETTTSEPEDTNE